MAYIKKQHHGLNKQSDTDLLPNLYLLILDFLSPSWLFLFPLFLSAHPLLTFALLNVLFLIIRSVHKTVTRWQLFISIVMITVAYSLSVLTNTLLLFSQDMVFSLKFFKLLAQLSLFFLLIFLFLINFLFLIIFFDFVILDYSKFNNFRCSLRRLSIICVNSN